MSELIYLDHAATTPVHPAARDAMQPFLGQNYANPSSIYRSAQETRAALDRARDSVGDCLAARSQEIVFTSGGTEGNNAAIKGVAFASRDRGRHIVTTAIEHHAVLHPIEELTERFGFEATVLPVGSSGIIDPDDVERALRPDTVLISVMWANNEIGTIQPVAEIGAVARRRGIPFHVDAVQAAAYLSVELADMPIDLLTLSAHKFYGPKGTGLLVLRPGTPWWPLITGGGQERNRRAGTENVAGIVGMACALQIAVSERESLSSHLTRLRDYLLRVVPKRITGVRINGDVARRLPNNANFSFEGVHGESLLVALDLAGIMAASGSACTSGSLDPSHVLQALGLPRSLAQGSLRLTVGRDTTLTEVERAVDELEGIVERLRRLAPSSREA